MTMLSVVIPAWNEENGIQEVMQRVLAIRPALAEVGVDDMELIVVDDGSTDRTAELVAQTPGVRLVRHIHNSGYGGALKTGFAVACGEWIGFLDADGTYPPDYFPALYRDGQAQGAELVIGSRMAGSDSEMPLVRRIGNLIFANLVSLVSAQRITDSASGMRLFKKDILEQFYPLPDGLNLTPVMSTRALHEHIKVIETPIPYSERVGRSKLNVVSDGMRFAQSIVWTALLYNPVRLLGLIGLLALAAAGLIGLGLLAARAQGVTSVGSLGAFVLFTALVLTVAGVSIFALGASFNYFVSLFHKRPIRQGLLGRPLFAHGIERYFGTAGLLAFILGVVVAALSLIFGLQGWPLSRLWIYYLAAAGLTLVGIQLSIAWVQVQVLEALKARDVLVVDDMAGKEYSEPGARVVTPGPAAAPALNPAPRPSVA